MRLILAALFSIVFSSTYGQTQFWSDTFEDAGAPSSGSRTPSSNVSSGGPPATRYFWRCGTANISSINVYSSFEGSKFWAGEDHRLSPISQVPEQSITWSSINISGKTNIVFKALFAAGSAAGNNWDIQPNSAFNDFVGVEYRIDGGAWQNGICFMASNPAISTPLSINSNPGTGAGQDSVGDGVVFLNSAVFSEFTFNVSGTGTTLDLRLRAHSNGTSEEWAIDNIRLFHGLGTLPVKLSDFKGTAEVAGNALSWISENELDNAGFEIERSTDGVYYEKVGMVSGNGNSSSRKEYHYVDKYAVPVTAYYRLKQLGVNGRFSYSAVVLIRRARGADVLAYPNPFANRLFVELKNTNSNNIKGLQLMDVAGRLYPVTVSYTVNGFMLSTDQLQSGVYILQWSNEGTVYRQMVIRSR